MNKSLKIFKKNYSLLCGCSQIIKPNNLEIDYKYFY